MRCIRVVLVCSDLCGVHAREVWVGLEELRLQLESVLNELLHTKLSLLASRLLYGCWILTRIGGRRRWPCDLTCGCRARLIRNDSSKLFILLNLSDLGLCLVSLSLFLLSYGCIGITLILASSLPGSIHLRMRSVACVRSHRSSPFFLICK